jgi:carbonic anhydrase
MHKILNGIRRFQRNVFPKYEKAFQELASSQNPEALLITCSDSRVVPELFTQCGPGDLFVYRNAGNIVPPYRAEDGSGTLATIEYAVSMLHVKSLIVCGHSDCGAMKGVLHPETVRQLPLVERWLRQAECARRIVCEHHEGVPEHEKLQLLSQENVIAQLESVRTHPCVAVALARNQLQLYGLFYNISSGHISAYDQDLGRFAPLSDSVPPAGPRHRVSGEKQAA